MGPMYVTGRDPSDVSSGPITVGEKADGKSFWYELLEDAKLHFLTRTTSTHRGTRSRDGKEDLVSPCHDPGSTIVSERVVPFDLSSKVLLYWCRSPYGVGLGGTVRLL